MGGISTSFVCGRKPILVNLIGVDGAGKTTILYKYKLGFDTPVETIHTIGFNVEVIKYKNFSFQITDFGGGDKVQPIISRITKDTPVLIFVIDSSDRTYDDYSRDRLRLWASTAIVMFETKTSSAKLDRGKIFLRQRYLGTVALLACYHRNQRLYLQWEEFRVVLYAEGNQYSPAYVVGMDGAGKTTILYKNKFGFDQPIHANPTIGFNIEVIKYKNFSFQITDFGGGGKIQPMNARLCKDLPVLIFVIDSSDRTYDHYSKDRLSLWCIFFLVGFDSAGKTTILYKYKLGFDKLLYTIHTIAFNNEVIKYKNFAFQVTDFGGSDMCQPLLYSNFKGRSVLIFVIDSSDRMYIDYAKTRLNDSMEANEVEDVLLLVFANKQDLPGAFTAAEIIDHYKLEELKCRWHVQPCVATTGQGICDGFEWLCKNL